MEGLILRYFDLIDWQIKELSHMLKSTVNGKTNKCYKILFLILSLLLYFHPSTHCGVFPHSAKSLRVLLGR